MATDRRGRRGLGCAGRRATGRSFREFARDPTVRFELAVSEHEAAERHLRSNALEAAEGSCRRALEDLDKLTATWPREPRYLRRRGAGARHNGHDRVCPGASRAAESAFYEAIVLWSRVVAEDQTAVEDRCQMAACIYRRGLRLARPADGTRRRKRSGGGVCCVRVPPRLHPATPRCTGCWSTSATNSLAFSSIWAACRTPSNAVPAR